jgi:glycosyltransferase involved in cell wall biosynthesis
MKIEHYMRKEDSGLVRSTLELAQYEEKQGNKVCIRTPHDNKLIYGENTITPDILSIHSQMPMPTFMWMHGEPLSSVANGVSMKAIIDLSSKCDAFFCMRKDEHSIWNSIKRTFLVPKGIDLEIYKPLKDTEKLSGSPAVLYCENWRGQRNPLYLCVAMQKVWEKFPEARLHLYNVQDKKMLDTFKTLIENNKWSVFIRSLQGQVKDINKLYNKADIVVSCLYPLYARSIEAFGAGRAFISPGYSEHDYPYTCELNPDSMADAIINCWENYDKIDYRKWAKDHHDVGETVKQAVEIYGKYL